LKPEVVLATIIDPERCKWPQNAYKCAGIALLISPTGFLLVARSDHTTGSRNIKQEVVFEVQKMARYASFCLIIGPLKGELPVFARLSPVWPPWRAPRRRLTLAGPAILGLGRQKYDKQQVASFYLLHVFVRRLHSSVSSPWYLMNDF